MSGDMMEEDGGGMAGFPGHPFMGMGRGPSSSSSSSHRHRRKSAPTTHDLDLSLEDLYRGVTKKMKITRNRFNDHGDIAPTSKVVEIDVKAGWKAGTKLTFEGEGDEESKGHPGSDVIFVIREKSHPRFQRRGDDLIHKRPLTLTQALCGHKFTLELLDGSSVDIDTTNEIIHPGYEKIIANKGMPNTKSKQYGGLIVQFDVIFPSKTLSEEQKKKLWKQNLIEKKKRYETFSIPFLLSFFLSCHRMTVR